MCNKFLLISITVCFVKLSYSSSNDPADFLKPQAIAKLVKMWSHQMGDELHKLSLTMTRKKKVTESFSSLKNKIYAEDGKVLIEDIASEMKELVAKKQEAVRRIAEYAEFLAYHRNIEEIKADDPFEFYDADNITDTSPSVEREDLLQTEIREAECEWWCNQKDLPPLHSSTFTKAKFSKLFLIKNTDDFGGNECDCENPPNRMKYDKEHYNWLPMTNETLYGYPVNKDLSVVKVVPNIWERDRHILEGIRWSEPLDMVFKNNLELDPTLKYQYFTSPLGYMRHFPAVAWSQEQYDQTYDPRTRSWYTEAMTSPKDIVILVDRSGSMRQGLPVMKQETTLRVEGSKRKLSEHIVNNILDTLNDNDFVNIYVFTNTTEPLVSCFNDTLVPANEENLRLLRESLRLYGNVFKSNITLGLNKAYEILADAKEQRESSQCNQAIMLITEGLDYGYWPETFDKPNDTVRIFTYNLGIVKEDKTIMEEIACTNKGFFVTISYIPEVREKVLKYLNIMSRPVNYDYKNRQKEIWSYLQIDLADRRYSNWLWRKYEGNRQRQVFLDHAKREFYRLGHKFTSSHMLLQLEHEYEKYETRPNFDYMTTVSVPVYGRREEDIDLIGVAAVDIPIKFLNSLIPHHKLGVNGYAFILTNNGYILMHPRHRREFEDIPKPTFNRVDFLEVEILDDSSEPRIFDDSIVELREKIVQRQKGNVLFKVKTAIDDMKRIILSKRRYYYTDIGPFSLGIALPDKYGLIIVNNTVNYEYGRGLLDTSNWKVHPDWNYCKQKDHESAEANVLDCLINRRKSKPLFASLLFDAHHTKWFKDKIPEEGHFVRKHLVKNVFMATHSGLTRWRIFENSMMDYEENKFDHYRAIDEDWYKRAAEENFKNENMFIYSVPWEISGYENNTMITSTNAIFVKEKSRKTPIAVVGVQFNHRAMYELYSTITSKCYGKRCHVTCESDYLTCFILDNNAYVVIADEIEHTGRYIGDIRPDIMYQLYKNGVYKPTRMFDYQAICQKPPPEIKKKAKKSVECSNIASRFHFFISNLMEITNWAFATILMLARAVFSGPDYHSIKNETLAYEKLELGKTFPTPCDTEMYLFTMDDNFSSNIPHTNKTSKFDCPWPYVIERIPNSNLLFMAINANCKLDTTNAYRNSPTPTEIEYNQTLPCYIALRNYKRRIYMNCYKYDPREEYLNTLNRTYCGHVPERKDKKKKFEW